MAKELKGQHRYNEFSAENVAKRVKAMVDCRENLLSLAKEFDLEENLQIKLSYGNRKTGALVPSISLIPVADCGKGCKVCSRGCYDVRNVCYLPSVQRSRAMNSAVWKNDPDRYMEQVKKAVQFLRFFRWHVGGDIKDKKYLSGMVAIAEATPTCEFLVFTKEYDLVNQWLDERGAFPKNLHVIFSDWKGAEFENPHGLPVSSPLWADGTKGAHCTEDAFLCPGKCEECAEARVGCWSATKGQTILFEAH